MSDDLLGAGKVAEATAEMTKELRQLVYDLLGPAAGEAGEYLRDRVAWFRADAALRALQRARRRVAESGLEPQTIEPRLALTLVERASFESDEYLTERWAGLIASASTAREILPSFPNILADLSPEEARILDCILGSRVPISGLSGRVGADKREVMEAVGLGEGAYLLRMQNLYRLQLIEQLTYGGTETTPGWFAWGIEGHVGLSLLGDSFVQACQGPPRTGKASG